MKAVTAVISVAAALMMFWVVPRALMLRSPAQLEVEVQESKQAQKALQTILDNAPVGIWLVGVDKRYRFVNKTFCDAVGIAESQFLAATHLPDLFGTEVAANCMKSDQECLAKETPHISYEELTFVDGKQHMMEITKVKLRDSAGVTTGAIGIAIDITERKQAEALERKHFNELQAVYLIGNAIRGAESPDQVYEKAMESVLRILKADRVSILLPDAEGVMRFVAWRGLSDAYREAADGHSPWTQATVDPQPVLVDDIELDADWAHFLPMARAEGISAFGFIPLVLHGHLLGKFMVYFNQPHRFTEDEARLAQTIASYISLTTESKKAEAELLLRAQLLDSVSDTIFLLDLDGKFVYLNEAAWKTRGYTRGEMMGIDLHVLDTPKYEKFIADRFREIMEKGQCIFESEHRRKDGSVMPVEINARTIELGGHKRLLSIIRDITERKQVEGILSESEERYRALFEQGADPIWLLDAQTGDIVDFNTAAHESLGYTREEFARLSIPDMEVIESPEETALHIEKIKAQGSDVFETTHRTKQGELRYVLVSVKKVTFGGATYLQCIQRDITERKEFEEELKHSNTDLEQFAYAASHDMRQPLRMISSYLQLLESDLAPVLTEETRQNLQYATEGAKRMDQMLMALLDYSRIGRKADTMAVIDSRAVMDEALHYLEPAIGEAQADVRIEGVWPHLFASRDEILRLFQNLVDNALKYRLPDRKPEVVIAAQTVGGEWRLEVRDNGIGLLQGHEARLFKVFERLQSRSRYPGTGIGLALCRKIAEHHKGRIRVESPGENRGCTFIVTLPVSLPSSSGGA